jgi:hypothetical protein
MSYVDTVLYFGLVCLSVLNIVGGFCFLKACLCFTLLRDLHKRHTHTQHHVSFLSSCMKEGFGIKWVGCPKGFS